MSIERERKEEKYIFFFSPSIEIFKIELIEIGNCE